MSLARTIHVHTGARGRSGRTRERVNKRRNEIRIDRSNEGGKEGKKHKILHEQREIKRSPGRYNVEVD